MHQKKATRREGIHGRASVQSKRDALILTRADRGGLLLGLMTALAFGVCAIHWAWFAC